jgi:hypothetical protein
MIQDLYDFIFGGIEKSLWMIIIPQASPFVRQNSGTDKYLPKPYLILIHYGSSQ